jgi:hypothetical protein
MFNSQNNDLTDYRNQLKYSSMVENQRTNGFLQGDDLLLLENLKVKEKALSKQVLTIKAMIVSDKEMKKEKESSYHYPVSVHRSRYSSPVKDSSKSRQSLLRSVRRIQGSPTALHSTNNYIESLSKQMSLLPKVPTKCSVGPFLGCDENDRNDSNKLSIDDLLVQSTDLGIQNSLEELNHIRAKRGKTQQEKIQQQQQLIAQYEEVENMEKEKEYEKYTISVAAQSYRRKIDRLFLSNLVRFKSSSQSFGLLLSLKGKRFFLKTVFSKLRKYLLEVPVAMIKGNYFYYKYLLQKKIIPRFLIGPRTSRKTHMETKLKIYSFQYRQYGKKMIKELKHLIQCRRSLELQRKVHSVIFIPRALQRNFTIFSKNALLHMRNHQTRHKKLLFHYFQKFAHWKEETMRKLKRNVIYRKQFQRSVKFYFSSTILNNFQVFKLLKGNCQRKKLANFSNSVADGKYLLKFWNKLVRYSHKKNAIHQKLISVKRNDLKSPRKKFISSSNATQISKSQFTSVNQNNFQSLSRVSSVSMDSGSSELFHGLHKPIKSSLTVDTAEKELEPFPVSLNEERAVQVDRLLNDKCLFYYWHFWKSQAKQHPQKYLQMKKKIFFYYLQTLQKTETSFIAVGTQENEGRRKISSYFINDKLPLLTRKQLIDLLFLLKTWKLFLSKFARYLANKRFLHRFLNASKVSFAFESSHQPSRSRKQFALAQHQQRGRKILSSAGIVARFTNEKPVKDNHTLYQIIFYPFHLYQMKKLFLKLQIILQNRKSFSINLKLARKMTCKRSWNLWTRNFQLLKLRNLTRYHSQLVYKEKIFSVAFGRWRSRINRIVEQRQLIQSCQRKSAQSESNPKYFFYSSKSINIMIYSNFFQNLRKNIIQRKKKLAIVKNVRSKYYTKLLVSALRQWSSHRKDIYVKQIENYQQGKQFHIRRKLTKGWKQWHRFLQIVKKHSDRDSKQNRSQTHRRGSLLTGWNIKKETFSKQFSKPIVLMKRYLSRWLNHLQLSQQFGRIERNSFFQGIISEMNRTRKGTYLFQWYKVVQDKIRLKETHRMLIEDFSNSYRRGVYLRMWVGIYREKNKGKEFHCNTLRKLSRYLCQKSLTDWRLYLSSRKLLRLTNHEKVNQFLLKNALKHWNQDFSGKKLQKRNVQKNVKKFQLRIAFKFFTRSWYQKRILRRRATKLILKIFFKLKFLKYGFSALSNCVQERKVRKEFIMERFSVLAERQSFRLLKKSFPVFMVRMKKRVFLSSCFRQLSLWKQSQLKQKAFSYLLFLVLNPPLLEEVNAGSMSIFPLSRMSTRSNDIIDYPTGFNYASTDVDEFTNDPQILTPLGSGSKEIEIRRLLPLPQENKFSAVESSISPLSERPVEHTGNNSPYARRSSQMEKKISFRLEPINFVSESTIERIPGETFSNESSSLQQYTVEQGSLPAENLTWIPRLQSPNHSLRRSSSAGPSEIFPSQLRRSSSAVPSLTEQSHAKNNASFHSTTEIQRSSSAASSMISPAQSRQGGSAAAGLSEQPKSENDVSFHSTEQLRRSSSFYPAASERTNIESIESRVLQSVSPLGNNYPFPSSNDLRRTSSAVPSAISPSQLRRSSSAAPSTSMQLPIPSYKNESAASFAFRRSSSAAASTVAQSQMRRSSSAAPSSSLITPNTESFGSFALRRASSATPSARSELLLRRSSSAGPASILQKFHSGDESVTGNVNNQSTAAIDLLKSSSWDENQSVYPYTEAQEEATAPPSRPAITRKRSFTPKAFPTKFPSFRFPKIETTTDLPNFPKVSTAANKIHLDKSELDYSHGGEMPSKLLSKRTFSMDTINTDFSTIKTVQPFQEASTKQTNYPEYFQSFKTHSAETTDNRSIVSNSSTYMERANNFLSINKAIKYSNMKACFKSLRLWYVYAKRRLKTALQLQKYLKYKHFKSLYAFTFIYKRHNFNEIFRMDRFHSTSLIKCGIKKWKHHLISKKLQSFSHLVVSRNEKQSQQSTQLKKSNTGNSQDDKEEGERIIKKKLLQIDSLIQFYKKKTVDDFTSSVVKMEGMATSTLFLPRMNMKFILNAILKERIFKHYFQKIFFPKLKFQVYEKSVFLPRVHWHYQSTILKQFISKWKEYSYYATNYYYQHEMKGNYFYEKELQRKQFIYLYDRVCSIQNLKKESRFYQLKKIRLCLLKWKLQSCKNSVVSSSSSSQKKIFKMFGKNEKPFPVHPLVEEMNENKSGRIYTHDFSTLTKKLRQKSQQLVLRSKSFNRLHQETNQISAFAYYQKRSARILMKLFINRFDFFTRRDRISLYYILLKQKKRCIAKFDDFLRRSRTCSYNMKKSIYHWNQMNARKYFLFWVKMNTLRNSSLILSWKRLKKHFTKWVVTSRKKHKYIRLLNYLFTRVRQVVLINNFRDWAETAKRETVLTNFDLRRNKSKKLKFYNLLQDFCKDKLQKRKVVLKCQILFENKMKHLFVQKLFRYLDKKYSSQDRKKRMIAFHNSYLLRHFFTQLIHLKRNRVALTYRKYKQFHLLLKCLKLNSFYYKHYVKNYLRKKAIDHQKRKVLNKLKFSSDKTLQLASDSHKKNRLIFFHILQNRYWMIQDKRQSSSSSLDNEAEKVVDDRKKDKMELVKEIHSYHEKETKAEVKHKTTKEKLMKKLLSTKKQQPLSIPSTPLISSTSSLSHRHFFPPMISLSQGSTADEKGLDCMETNSKIVFYRQQQRKFNHLYDNYSQNTVKMAYFQRFVMNRQFKKKLKQFYRQADGFRSYTAKLLKAFKKLFRNRNYKTRTRKNMVFLQFYENQLLMKRFFFTLDLEKLKNWKLQQEDRLCESNCRLRSLKRGMKKFLLHLPHKEKLNEEQTEQRLLGEGSLEYKEPSFNDDVHNYDLSSDEVERTYLRLESQDEQQVDEFLKKKELFFPLLQDTVRVESLEETQHEHFRDNINQGHEVLY